MDQQQTQVRFVIVGHVDHGKSTLIGRLLYDTGCLPASKLAEIEQASRELGREVEFAYVMDHLEEERSRNITIDTAQIYFKTAQADYVIIDAPGHREFMRNMITGASQADAAVIMLDIREGIREQTRRHAFVLSMLGIDQVILMINKMDLVDWQETAYRKAADELSGWFRTIGIKPMFAVPVSAKLGDNLVNRSTRMSWYSGPTLLEALAQLKRKTLAADQLRLSVQDRYAIDGKDIFVGRVERGTIRQGMDVVLLPAGLRTKVRSIEAFEQDKTSAEAGECLGFTIASPADGIQRGSVVCPAEQPAQVTSRFAATLFWLADKPFNINDPVWLRCSTQEVPARVEKIERLTNSSTLELLAEQGTAMEPTQVAQVIIRTDQPVVVEAFKQTPELGRFVLMRDNDAEAGGIVIQAKA